MLIGYIDDSGSTKSGLFTLSCIVGHTTMWMWIEWAWSNCLENKNQQLKAEGRKELPRFHAADCSSRVGEFKGWSVCEQIELMSCLIRVFQRHPLAIVSYTLSLPDLVAEFPEAKKNSHGLAHIILLTHIVKYIGERVLSDPRYLDEKIAFVHDRTSHGPVLLEAFEHIKNDETFSQRDQLTTFSFMGWEEAIPLQLADFLAYENFKIFERQSAGGRQRKSMDLILGLDSFGGRGAKLLRAGIREIKGKLDAESRKTLFKNARIRTSAMK